MVRALDDRDEAMQRRARGLAERAIERDEAWVRRLGCPPADPAARELWMAPVSTVAAYRDRWKIEALAPLGSDKAGRTIEASRGTQARTGRGQQSAETHARDHGTAIRAQ